MAKRFDRFIANIPDLKGINNFDEFLSEEVLSCPVEGCEWEGKNLSCHCNYTHGITADELKKILGFCRGSGIVCQPTSRLLTLAALKRVNGVKKSNMRLFTKHTPIPIDQSKPPVRKEAREKRSKVFAIRRASYIPVRGYCIVCGSGFDQSCLGNKLYCSTRCRSKYYSIQMKKHPLTCRECGKHFMGTRRQAKNPSNAFCSRICWNKESWKTAVHARMEKYLAIRRKNQKEDEVS